MRIRIVANISAASTYSTIGYLEAYKVDIILEGTLLIGLIIKPRE